MMSNIEHMLVVEASTLRDALKAIDKNARGFCFVVDSDQKLIGVLTDGDIRRAILRDEDLAGNVAGAMTTDFVSLPIEATESDIQQALSHRINYIPLLDKQGRVIDYASHFKAHRIPILEPLLDGKELEYVSQCITTNWISSRGRFVTEFESLFSKRHEEMAALAVSHGTAALHLAMVSLGVGRGDEVIVPDFTFAASANAVVHAQAEPVFVDIDPETLTMDPQAVEQAVTPKTRAIMPVHLYGHACDMDPLLAIAKKHDLFVIEDAAEALGTQYKGRPAGCFGDAAAFSFFGNKTITTGEGGMVLFRDLDIADRARMLRDHGMSKSKRYWHEEIGFNYRLTNIQAAVGVAQFERLELFLTQKRSIAQRYIEALADQPLLSMPVQKDWQVHSFWIFTLMVDASIDRDAVMEQLQRNGVDTRPFFYPLGDMPPYKGYRRVGDCAVTKDVSRRGICLPTSVGLSDQEVSHVISELKNVLNTIPIAGDVQ